MSFELLPVELQINILCENDDTLIHSQIISKNISLLTRYNFLIQIPITIQEISNYIDKDHKNFMMNEIIIDRYQTINYLHYTYLRSSIKSNVYHRNIKLNFISLYDPPCQQWQGIGPEVFCWNHGATGCPAPKEYYEQNFDLNRSKDINGQIDLLSTYNIYLERDRNNIRKDLLRDKMLQILKDTLYKVNLKDNKEFVKYYYYLIHNLKCFKIDIIFIKYNDMTIKNLDKAKNQFDTLYDQLVETIKKYI